MSPFTPLSIVLLIFMLFAHEGECEKKFSVLRVHVRDEAQLDFLQSQYLNSSQFDFWKEPTVVGEDAHVMVGDGLTTALKDQLTRLNTSYEVMIDDVSELMRQRSEESARTVRRQRLSRHPKSASFLRRLRDPGEFRSSAQSTLRERIGFSLTRYHSFAEIINYLNSLTINFPDRVRVQPIGTTHEGRQIPLIRIGTPAPPGVQKPAIWIDGGWGSIQVGSYSPRPLRIHAREWVSPAVTLYFIDQLVLEYDTQPAIRRLVDSMDWFIVPLLNPDGYEYSRSSSTDPEIRLWRKNRSPLQCTQVNAGLFAPQQTRCCQGVDLNRNFDWFFGQVGSSTDPCSEIYSGTFAFSEPETRSVRDFVSQQQGRIKAFLTFHSYSQILMYPFGHALRTYPQDVDELSNTALKAVQALQSVFGTKYTVGTGADTLYPASGGSEDWAKGRLGVKYSYLFELRPEDNVYDGFLLSENLILPTAKETWEAVKVIASTAERQFAVQPSPVPLPAPPPPQVNTIGGVPTVPLPGAGFIPQRRVCRDLDQLCTYWAQNGACQAWPQMQERCPLSCGYCEVPAS